MSSKKSLQSIIKGSWNSIISSGGPSKKDLEELEEAKSIEEAQEFCNKFVDYCKKNTDFLFKTILEISGYKTKNFEMPAGGSYEKIYNNLMAIRKSYGVAGHPSSPMYLSAKGQGGEFISYLEENAGKPLRYFLIYNEVPGIKMEANMSRMTLNTPWADETRKMGGKKKIAKKVVKKTIKKTGKKTAKKPTKKVTKTSVLSKKL